MEQQHDSALNMRQSFNSLDKGAPFNLNGLNQSQTLNLLQEDLSLPLAVLSESALQNNQHWMDRYLKKAAVQIAPHGKTTMAPDLFKLQQGKNTWGITLATVQQVKVARAHGFKRILMANQLIGKQNSLYIINEIKQHDDFEFYCLIDNEQNMTQLEHYAQQLQLQRPIQVLLEIGVAHGRTGVRDDKQVINIANKIHQSSYLALAGIECYEGVIHDDPKNKTLTTVQKVDAFLIKVITLAQRIETLGYYDNSELILSGGGSVYYDRVIKQFKQSSLVAPYQIIIRPGCYLIHDKGIYEQQQDELLQRDDIATSIGGRLLPALEIWAQIQSLPEPGLAILGIGKRDVSFDAGLPIPNKWIQAGVSIPLNHNYALYDINDQHAFMRFPKEQTLQIGDIIAMDISHPCLTFDKWQVIPLVDDNYNVIKLIRTYF